MSEGSPEQGSEERHSVLGELPRTRPQRASRRRETARALANAPTAASAPTAATAPKTTSKKTSASKGRHAPRSGARADSRSKKRTVPPPPSQPTPRQGYEAEQEIVGTPVTPPTGTELAGAVAELAGELVQTGVAAGGRLLKGALSRLTGA